MAPVHGKVTVGRHCAVIFIGRRRAHGQGQRIGVVICIEGNGHAFRRVFRLDLVIGCINPGGIVHPVIGNP